MKFLALVIFIFSIYPMQQTYSRKYNQTKFPFPVLKKNFSNENWNLYRSIVTGNKKNVNKGTINQLKRYGLIHLLTPSGIHLSSLLILIKFLPFLVILVTILFLFLIQYFDGYMSMERVLIFKLITSTLAKFEIGKINLEGVFLLTMAISFLFGHFQQSSLSLIYSFSFWGTIILFRKSPLKIILYMNLMLYFISSFTGMEHGLLSLVINPIFTSIMSIFFPILVLNIFLPDISFVTGFIDNFLSFYTRALNSIHTIDHLPTLSVSTISIMVFIILLQFKRLRLSVIILCFFGQSPPGKSKPLHFNSYSKYSSTQSYSPKKRPYWYYSESNKCKSKELEFFCKKKPSKKEGFSYHSFF